MFRDERNMYLVFWVVFVVTILGAASNNVLFVLPRKGVYEINRTGDIVWLFSWKDLGRHPHEPEILPNGNTLIVERTKILEVTTAGKVVWQLRVRDVSGNKRDKVRWFYKAERIAPH